MLTRIVETSEGYKIGDIYMFEGIAYKIVDMDYHVNLCRIYLTN